VVPDTKTLLRMVVVNRFPQLLWWGPDYVQFYNDPYIRSPAASTPTCRSDARLVNAGPRSGTSISPLIDRPFRGGDPTWNDDHLPRSPSSRFPRRDPLHDRLQPGARRDGPGGIGGVLATVHEITGKVVGERRVTLLRDLGNRLSHAQTSRRS